MRCKRLASKIGKFPIRSCSSGKEGKHYFIAYTSGYMQGQGWQAGRQAAGRPAETGSPKRSFRTTNDLHTRRQKKKERTKEVQQKGDAIYFSSFSSHSKLQGSLASLLDTKFCSAASKKFAPSPHAPSATQRLAPPRLPPYTTRQSYVLVSFPIGPRVKKKKLLQLLLAIACLPAPGKVPVYFFRGIRKKKSAALGFALSINLASEGKAKSFPHSQMGREIKIWQRLDGVVVYYYSSIMAEKRAHLFLQLPPSPLS